MKKNDVATLMQGLKQKAHGNPELVEVVEEIDEIMAALNEIEDGEEPRIRLPYVNTSTIGTGTWK